MPLIQAIGTLLDRRATGPALELTVRAPELARLLTPGQPVLVRPGPTLAPYLRRTFYPIALGAEDFTIRIPPPHILGAALSTDWGDAWLRIAPVGAEIDCLGPVGNGFAVAAGVRNVLCLGEGNLAWGLLPLIQWADAAGLSVTFVVGSPSTRWALPANRLPAGVEYHLVTSDGRPDVIRPLLSTLFDLLPWADGLYAALPVEAYPALGDTVRQARYALSPGFAQAIYGGHFLCGVGACQACVADVAGGRRRVCLRGPVFDLTEIVRGDRE